MINVAADPSLAFSHLTCHLEDTGIGAICCTVPHNSKKTEPRKSDQKAFTAAGKNTGVVLVPCHTWTCVPTIISGGVDISNVPRWHLLWKMSSQSAGCKPDIWDKSHSSLKLCFTKIQSLCSNFVECESNTLAVYVKEGLPFAWVLSLENVGDSYLCFRLALLHSASYSFSSMDHLLCLYAQFWCYFV